MRNLGTLSGDVESLAYGVNTSGQVVGYSIAPNMAFTAFVWQGGPMYALERLISPLGSNLHVQIAWAINNQGQIAAEANVIGSQEVLATLLTPIPPVAGDCNCDQVVNMDDILSIILHWGQSQPQAGTADLTGDGVVDINDLMLVLNNWG